ncbi:hypothetical protein [Roseivirga sp. UBA1976]|mgnify:CR=1 FL=1|uniref:DUF6913 domain-containing protein n=1 Tax=Roseivirga sp. UBA1976 TaxID=1947386 RepID=UPI00257C9649|nr:hypothetical protein [Roseivirga sp. UBA1976]|tara:strand:- start:9122 stop:9631 length:510 start_codon:yes stop_codon:yes gene_type:complete
MSILGRKILGLVNKPRKREYKEPIPPYEKATNIGVLYTYEGEKKEESINQLVEELGKHKHIQVLCFVNQKEVPSLNRATLKIDQISSWGKLNSPETESFLDTSFDYLLHLDFELNEIAQTLLNRTKAKCRVGFHSETATNYYELMIGINKSAGTANFAEQMVKYIKAIR